jgi:hypothetical protein
MPREGDAPTRLSLATYRPELQLKASKHQRFGGGVRSLGTAEVGPVVPHPPVGRKAGRLQGPWRRRRSLRRNVPVAPTHAWPSVRQWVGWPALVRRRGDCRGPARARRASPGTTLPRSSLSWLPVASSTRSASARTASPGCSALVSAIAAGKTTPTSRWGSTGGPHCPETTTRRRKPSPRIGADVLIMAAAPWGKPCGTSVRSRATSSSDARRVPHPLPHGSPSARD